MCSRLLATIFIIYCFNSGLCQELVELACSHNRDCEQFATTTVIATCTDDVCVCQENGTDTRCEPKISKSSNLIGGVCPCKIEFSSCENGICLCKGNYTASKDKRRCIPKKVSLGEQCETNNQCLAYTQFSKCENNKCTCNDKYVRNNGHCLSAIGRQCSVNQECQSFTKYTICSKAECVCRSTHVASSDQKVCLPNVGYLENCSETAQCNRNLGVGAICKNGVCVCNDDHYNITVAANHKTYCERKVAVGDYCNEHKECQQYAYHIDEQTMECYMNECTCRNGYRVEYSNCIKSGSYKPLALHVALLAPIVIVAQLLNNI